MAFFVKFWGTRGSIPTPGARTRRYGGNTSCVEVRTEDAIFICDGGTGLRELGIDLSRRYPSQPLTLHMFFSHPHWDHIQGFPFFAPVYAPTNTIYVYGASKGDHSIADLLSGQMQSSYFPVDFKDLSGKIIAAELDGGSATVHDVRVTAFRQQHPGGSLGFIFEHDARKVVYSTDNELDKMLPDPDAVLRDPWALRKLPDEMVEAARGADLLIADAQYTDGEYAPKVGWGHPRASTVVDWAVAAGVKHVALYHHDPMHADRDVEAKVDSCNERAKRHGAKLTVFAAREGMELKIEDW